MPELTVEIAKSIVNSVYPNATAHKYRSGFMQHSHDEFVIVENPNEEPMHKIGHITSFTEKDAWIRAARSILTVISGKTK